MPPRNPDPRIAPLAGKVPVALDAAVRAICARRGISVSQALNEALAVWSKLDKRAVAGTPL